ncbi:15004_t:CDS:2 [Funneliformis geosporum]|uniref:15004_t:CDS:1 n=1 Tax=Funneliformis geosporum TaxID=1117311 RepID=A0A9W4SGD9_9GLOM|nr:15004_t:CDS:2 [Funneliformis geosporum]
MNLISKEKALFQVYDYIYDRIVELANESKNEMSNATNKSTENINNLTNESKNEISNLVRQSIKTIEENIFDKITESFSLISLNESKSKSEDVNDNVKAVIEDTEIVNNIINRRRGGGEKSFYFDELASLKSEDISRYLGTKHPEHNENLREFINIIRNSISICITNNEVRHMSMI